MVMTLRKRVPLTRRSPSQSPVREIIATKKKKNSSLKTLKSRNFRGRSKRENAVSESELESEFESESGSESESEKENAGAPSGYEKFREQRIRENKERMEKLGIFSLSSIFNSGNGGALKRPGRSLKNQPKKKSYPPLIPRRRSYESRRSARLRDVPQANYVESVRDLKDMGICIPDAWKPEVYTEEDEKLLGDCDAKWTLNVDGFGEDGELLYDPVNGTSCHQCRKKTLRKHTYCSKCRSGQGQLCGDCLYTRYGENVLEAVKNPTWSCPACRGICNCSRCRRAKGWPHVTIVYPKVIEKGFKSVAHYLILNQRAGNKPKESEDGIAVVDLEEESPAPPPNAGPDTSSEWSESESDDSDSDDDSQSGKEKHVDVADVSGEAVVNSGVLQAVSVNGSLNC